MAYSRVGWVDGTTPVNAANLLHMEDELVLLDALPRIPTPLVEGNWLTVTGGAMVWAPAPAGGGGGTDWEGAWNPATPYVKGDVVTYNGVTYAAVNDSTGQTPPQAVVAYIPLVTALPASPADGQECILTDSLTVGTYFWRLRYVAGRASNKWVFVGGSPIEAEAAGSVNTASTAYVDLGGPSIALPVAGDYLIEMGHRNWQTGATGTCWGYMSYAIGATAPSDADAVFTGLNNANFQAHISRAQKKLGLGAVTLAARYKVAGGGTGQTSLWQDRWMMATPIAVGG
jgi:hypothetical protein